MRVALLVELFHQLPAIPDGDVLAGRSAELQSHLERFRQGVANNYTEGTLQRLLSSTSMQMRRAAILALGLQGTMLSNAAVVDCLHDEEPQVSRLAADALWNIWYRAEGESNKRELHRLAQLKNPQKALRGLNSLIERVPGFAEAYNQRAILNFQIGEFQRALADCEKTLKLNPFHFGAQAGVAHCLVKLRKPRAALRAYRHALKINPALEDIAEAIRSLEESLGEGR